MLKKDITMIVSVPKKIGPVLEEDKILRMITSTISMMKFSGPSLEAFRCRIWEEEMEISARKNTIT